MQHSLGIDDLANVEMELREGQAYDALHSLRQIIQEWNYNLLDKKDNIHGIAENLRSGKFLRNLNADKQVAASKYRCARHAMLNLGLAETHHRWQELKDDQLWGKNVTEVRSMGDGQKRDPWFWSIVKPDGLTEAQEKDWSTESEYYSILI